MSRLDPTVEPKGDVVRRIEVTGGGERRRRWSEDEKAQAVEESLLAMSLPSSLDWPEHGGTLDRIGAGGFRNLHRDGLVVILAPGPAHLIHSSTYSSEPASGVLTRQRKTA